MSWLRAWLPVIVWAAFIFFMSTGNFSSNHTEGFFIPLLHSLLPRAPEQSLIAIHFFFRKSAHACEYFILGILLIRAIRRGKRGWQFRWALLAVLLAALYASSDEFHQIFVPDRQPSVWDVLLDTSGATVAQFAAWIVMRRDEGGSAAEAEPETP